MDDVSKRLHECERWFKGTRYEEAIREASDLFLRGNVEATKIKLEGLPTRESLLQELIEKLKGKPVYDTLVKMRDSKVKTNFEVLKGLFSLGTHTIIECEQGKLEYRVLLPLLLEKIGNIVYEL